MQKKSIHLNPGNGRDYNHSKEKKMVKGMEMRYDLYLSALQGSEP